nr:hypothetical protein [Tanacetum cinerariifolium]
MNFCTNLSNKVLDLESEVIDIKCTHKARIEKLESRVERLEDENKVLKELKSVHFIVDSDEPIIEKEKSSKLGRKIADIDANVEINLKKAQVEAYNLDLYHQEKVLSMLDVNDEELVDVEEVLEVVKAAKLTTKVVTTARVDVNAASVQDTPITAAKATKVSFPRKRRENEPRQEEIDVVSVINDVLPSSDDDSEEEVDVVGDLHVDNVIQNSEHEYSESKDSDLDNPLLPLPPLEPPDKEFDFEIDFEKEILVVRNVIVKFECIDARVKFNVFNNENDVFMFIMIAKEFSFLSAESEYTIFNPGISE